MKPKLGHQQPENSGTEAMGLASRSLDGERSESSEANKGKKYTLFPWKKRTEAQSKR